MKKGFVLLFLVLWIVVVVAVFGVVIYSFLSNLSADDGLNISEASEKNEIKKNNNNNIEIVTTSVTDVEKKTIYIIKEYKDNIAVYEVDEEGKEHLRETTHILTKYLPEIDRKKLQDGIKVVGKEELNKTLEDYE